MFRTNRRRGFTLLELLIASIMLAILMAASGFALSTAVKAQIQLQHHAQDREQKQALTSILQRDIENAFVEANGTTTMFMTSGSVPNALLTFTTTGPRISIPDTQSNSTNQNQVQPQSGFAIVSYVFDEGSRTLHRLVSRIPSLDSMPQPSGQSTAIATNITSFQMEFYDGTNQTFKQAWTYAFQKSTSGAGTGGATGAITAQPTDPNNDATLPTNVQITMDYMDEDGQTHHEVLTIPILVSTPLSANQKPGP